MKKTGKESINIIDVRHCSGYNFAYQKVCEMSAGHHSVSVKQINPNAIVDHSYFDIWFVILIIYIVISFIGLSLYDFVRIKY
jgi:hypothetical protein